jgi:aspartate carbamoyltransferase
MGINVFKERSLMVASDFSIDEKKYLFQKTRELKEAWANNEKDKLDSFRISDKDYGIYEVFLESSTRTRESFRNAAKFHGVKLSMFSVGSSSFNKKESFSDGFMTMAGYSNHIFIVRSKLEGLCKWLEIVGKQYAERNHLGYVPAFINAGDGKHEHPTQELLDEFTFIEDNNWDLDSIHIALVGDLFHGRTVHSKADGLTIFKNVKVDLIAPTELAMPSEYVSKMKKNGFEVRVFRSLQEYFASGDLAGKFYFTRPQLERMGEKILKRQFELREAITFKKEYLDRLRADTCFYHPLPRHKIHPAIPTFLDHLKLNHWEKQSINGMFVRIILQSAIAGRIGEDFQGETVKKMEFADDFVKEIKSTGSQVKNFKEGVNPLSNGVVIDRFCRGEAAEDIWAYLSKTMKIMDFAKHKGFIGVAESRKENGVFKGLMFLPKVCELSSSEIRRLAAVTGGCTINIIKDNQVLKKLRLQSPPRIYNITDTNCQNQDCISNATHFENVPPEFIRKGGGKLQCLYCDTIHKFKDIWQ